MIGSFGVRGRVAVVTGGAGAGLGRATVLHLAQQGAVVVAVDSHEKRVMDTAVRLQAEGLQVHGRVLDVANARDCDDVVADVARSIGSIDVVVNNAAINALARVEDVSLEQWDAVLATDLTGPFNLIRAVIPSMQEQRSGAIVNVASVAAYWAAVREGPYAAAKAGLLALTRVVAAENASFGIRCNAVAPGFIASKFADKFFEEEFADEVARIPLGRLGAAGEVASVIGFLASDASSYVTGECITVSGGWYMRP